MKYSKDQIREMLNAAGIDLDVVQQKAHTALFSAAESAETTISNNKAVIATAQAEIADATVQLTATRKTLAVVKTLA